MGVTEMRVFVLLVVLLVFVAEVNARNRLKGLRRARKMKTPERNRVKPEESKSKAEETKKPAPRPVPTECKYDGKVLKSNGAREEMGCNIVQCVNGKLKVDAVPAERGGKIVRIFSPSVREKECQKCTCYKFPFGDFLSCTGMSNLVDNKCPVSK